MGERKTDRERPTDKRVCEWGRDRQRERDPPTQGEWVRGTERNKGRRTNGQTESV